MSSAGPRRRPRMGRAARWRVGALLAIAAAGRVGAAEVPEGVPAGPWFLSPSLVVGYAYDTNPFLRSDSLFPRPASDRLFRVVPAVTAVLPFRESALTLDYSATRLDYAKTHLSRSLAQNAGADLTLGFSSFDRLSLRARLNRGVAETLAFDPGGEVVFQGRGFALSTFEVDANRAEYGHRGYRVRLTRNALNLEHGTDIAFFEYRGYDAEASYREPLSPRLWIVGDYEGRRYDHFLANEPAGSAPFRKERSDLARIGVQGRLGEREPFEVRVGWGRFRFPGSTGSDYQGVVVDATATFRIGGATDLEIALLRRPWPSFFLNNNFYLVQSGSVRVSRRWRLNSTAGAELLWQAAKYGDVESGLRRRDRTLRARVYANLMIRERLGFRMSVDDNRRSSNYFGQDYRGRVYFAGIVVGWF